MSEHLNVFKIATHNNQPSLVSQCCFALTLCVRHQRRSSVNVSRLFSSSSFTSVTMVSSALVFLLLVVSSSSSAASNAAAGPTTLAEVKDAGLCLLEDTAELLLLKALDHLAGANFTRKKNKR
jgi:hypothetical protein